MNLDVHPFIWILGVLFLCVFCLFTLAKMSGTPARLSRRRRRNYGKVIPRVKRPIVILNAKTDKN